MTDPAPSQLGALVRHLRATLEAAGKPDAALDARLLVEHFTGTSRTEAVTDPHRAVTPAQVDDIISALARRLADEPLHRILGARDFYGMTLSLSRETLEPRPDTEALVDLVLPSVRAFADINGSCRLLDMGTGTGAIVLALLSQEPRAQALATDISVDALATARANADMLGVGDRLQTCASHWFDAIDERFDVIVSNPPYIPSRDIALLAPEVRNYDPLAALDGGEDGLDAYRAIAEGCVSRLADSGVIAVEIGHDQEADVVSIFEDQGLRHEQSARDLGGVMRAMLFSLANA